MVKRILIADDLRAANDMKTVLELNLSSVVCDVVDNVVDFNNYSGNLQLVITDPMHFNPHYGCSGPVFQEYHDRLLQFQNDSVPIGFVSTQRKSDVKQILGGDIRVENYVQKPCSHYTLALRIGEFLGIECRVNEIFDESIPRASGPIFLKKS